MLETLHLVDRNNTVSSKFTLIQLANHYSDFQLGITSEPLDDYKKSAIKFVRKLSRKPYKLKYRDYCLSDYAIPLEQLPEHQIKLMVAINWVSEWLYVPYTSIKGFSAEYCNPSNQLPTGNQLVKHFITFDKYVELLTIEHKLNAMELCHE